MRPKLRKGPAAARVERRAASRSRRPEAKSPRSCRPGRRKVADSTGSTAGSTPVTSSSSPPTGRSINSSSVDSGRTTHSRPRACTRVPGLERVAWVMRRDPPVKGAGEGRCTRFRLPGTAGSKRRWIRPLLPKRACHSNISPGTETGTGIVVSPGSAGIRHPLGISPVSLSFFQGGAGPPLTFHSPADRSRSTSLPTMVWN